MFFHGFKIEKKIGSVVRFEGFWEDSFLEGDYEVWDWRRVLRCTMYNVPSILQQDARDKRQESRQNFGSGKGDFGRWISITSI
ncbi:MAG: hypothetical protein ACXIUQ_01520 [Cecembia sp.]